MAHVVLAVDDKAAAGQNISRHLEECGLTVIQAESASGAIIKIMCHSEIALVFINSRLTGPLDGSDLEPWPRLNHPRIVVMIATGGLARMERLKGKLVAGAFLKLHKADVISDSVWKALNKRASQ